MTDENEFKAVFHEIYMANYPLGSVEKILSMKQNFQGDLTNGDQTVRCDQLISLIYFKNNLTAKSLKIDLRLLADLAADHPLYYLTMTGAIRTSAELKRMDEVMPYAINYLKTVQEDFHGKLPVLAWFVEFYQGGENRLFSELELVLSAIVSEMGAQIDPSLPFNDRVNYLFKEFKRASKELGLFGRVYGPATIEQGEEILKDYLEKEPLGFYRDTAKMYRKNKRNPKR